MPPKVSINVDTRSAWIPHRTLEDGMAISTIKEKSADRAAGSGLDGLANMVERSIEKWAKPGKGKVPLWTVPQWKAPEDRWGFLKNY